MKVFLYKAKGALALAVAMSMFCPQVFAAEALSAEQQGVKAAPVVELTEEELAVQQLPTLTYEQALSKARQNSAELRNYDELADLLVEERKDLKDDLGSLKQETYDYQKWVDPGEWADQMKIYAANMERESTTLQRQLQYLVIEIGVKGNFVSILGQEDQLELAKMQADMQQKLYEQAQVKHRLGMLSTYGKGGLDEFRINAEKAKNDVAMAEAALDQTYTNFNRLLGENAENRYELVYDVVYEPYEMNQTLSQYINDKLNNDDLTIKLLEVSEDYAKFTNNYLSEDADASDRNEYGYDKAKRTLKAAKLEKENLIQNAYMTIKQLETQRASAEADLKKAETTYRMVEVNYQAGNVTKTALEQAEMGVVMAQNALKTNAYTHDLTIFQFENPTLLSNTNNK